MKRMTAGDTSQAIRGWTSKAEAALRNPAMAPSGLRLVDPAIRAPAPVNSVVLIGSYPPRRCGIATFTADVRDALLGASPGLSCDVFAMNDAGGPYAYGSEVV